MTQNFLYMFEFIVDDLLITRQNCCAPEEYPTCVSLTFRKNVYVNICDRPYGECVDLCNPKCCKCVLFALDSPINEDDRLLIHVNKMKDIKCKFLLGATDLPVKDIFDKVTDSFHALNPSYAKVLEKFLGSLPNTRDPSKSVITNCFECEYSDIKGRPEQYCPANELSKHLLPIFNLQNKQTGNLTLIIRIVCNGPNIVACYPYSKMCLPGCPPEDGLGEDLGKCGMTQKDDHEIENNNKNMCDKGCTNDCSKNSGNERERASGGGGNGYCTQCDPCKKPPPEPKVCKRYFACNLEKGCPCPECEDDCDRGNKFYIRFFKKQIMERICGHFSLVESIAMSIARFEHKIFGVFIQILFFLLTHIITWINNIARVAERVAVGYFY